MSIGMTSQQPGPPASMGGMFSAPAPKQPEAEIVEEIKEEKEEDEGGVYAYLESIGGPSREIVNQWKMNFGGVHMLPLNDDTVFIYRSLKRSEWNALKAQFMGAGDALTEDQKKEQIVNKCLLWPNINGTDYAFLEAGLVDTLYEAISVSSYFLAPQMVMNMVMRL